MTSRQSSPTPAGSSVNWDGSASPPLPAVFSLDDDGKLSFRSEAADTHICGEPGESLRDDVEEAADVCPPHAITVE
jgi:ferredoxin